MMPRYRVIGLLAALALAAGAALAANVGGSGVSGLRTHDHSSAGQGGATLGAHSVSGTLSSTKACAAGYTRVLPNFCKRNPPLPAYSALVYNTCTAVTPPSGDATGVLLSLQARAWSANAIADRYSYTATYTDAACVNVYSTIHAAGREFVATAGVVVADTLGDYFVPAAAPAIKFSLRDGGGMGDSYYLLIGYFD